MMEISSKLNRSAKLFFTLIAGFIAVALACNNIQRIPTPQRSPLVPSSRVTSPASASPPSTPSPSSTPISTTSFCADNSVGRTQDCDEFSHQLDTVSHYDQSGVLKIACQGWCQLKEGDTLETNSSGQAELNFSDCWPGRLFLYQTSTVNTLVNSCIKADFCPEGNCENPPAICVPNGALYADKCAGEFNPVTGNARIIKAAASFLVTYNQDAGDVTTIIVTDGAVYFRPLVQPETSQEGELSVVNTGQFFFTMPDATLHSVGGLEPGVLYSVEQLPQMAYELGLQDWLIQAGQTASEGGYLPTNWPAEFLPQTPSPTPCVPPANWVKIIVRPGDTLRELAHTYDSNVKGLMEANCLVDDQLVVGSDFYVPYIPTRTPKPPPPLPRPPVPVPPSITPAYWQYH